MLTACKPTFGHFMLEVGELHSLYFDLYIFYVVVCLEGVFIAHGFYWLHGYVVVFIGYMVM